MIIFYSGSSYTAVYPERLEQVKVGGFMMSYYEVKNKKAREDKRFKMVVKVKRSLVK